MANTRTNAPAFSQSALRRQDKPAAKAGAGDAISKNANIMDFRPSKSLASGLKRVGGRSGITRLGRRHPGSAGRTILKKYT